MRFRIILGIVCLMVSATLVSAEDISEAIERGDTLTVRSILARQPELLNNRNQDGLTPLNLAASKGRLTIVRDLLALGADWRIGDNEGSQPIHNAAAGGRTRIIDLLLDAGSDINVQDNNSETALLFSLSFGKFETAGRLLDRGADIRLANSRGLTPLHHAASQGSIDLCRRIIAMGADVNAAARDGGTPLQGAAMSGDLELARLLLEKGADTEARNNYQRTPLLLVARERGDAAMATLLLDRGANINAEDRYGDTPLSLAAWRGFRALLDLLLERGAALPATPEKRLEVAAYCADRGLAPLFARLADAGIDITMRNGAEKGFLHAAAAGGSGEICGLLIDKGLDVNGRDIYGRTPLHYAAERGRTEACRLLLARGATVDARSAAGYSPYNLAREFGYDATAALLVEHGASTETVAFPSLKGPYLGQTPPGDQPALFAPDIVASSRFKHGSITFTPDGLQAYWSSEYAFNDSGFTVGGILTSGIDNDRWTVPALARFSAVGNGDDVPFLAPDGKRLYFLSRRSDQPGGADGTERIWFVDRTDSGWSAPYCIAGGPNSHSLHWQFSVATNGNIYFSSRDPHGPGGGDIWVSRYVDGAWAKPEILEPELNSPSLEMCPFIAPDESYLIVSTDGGGGASGGIHLRISFRKPNGGWTKPVPLDGAGNIPAKGICPIVSGDGKYLFFNTSRGGAADIYWVDAGFIERLRREVLP